MIRCHSIPLGALLAGLLVSGQLLLTNPASAADVQVIDGGTLVMAGRTVRLWGIEAPSAEQVCTTTAGRSRPCGKRVRDQLRSAVQDDDLTCQPKAPGFELCRVAGLDIGALLVKEGLAKITDSARGDYQEIEARARAARVGLWE